MVKNFIILGEKNKFIDFIHSKKKKKLGYLSMNLLQILKKLCDDA